MAKSSLVPDLVRQHSINTLPRLKRFDGNSIASTLSEPERISSAFWRRYEEIAVDHRLTTDGKVGDRRILGRETLAALEKWHKPHRDGLDAHEKKLREDLRAAVTPSPSGDLGARIEAALVRAEVRRAASSLNAQEVEVLYRQADSPHIRQALEELPNITKRNGAVLVKPFVSDEVKEQALLEAGRRSLPEVAERLDDIAEVRGVYKSVANALKQEVEKAAPGAVEPAAVRVVA